MGESLSVAADQEVDPMTVALYYEDAYLDVFEAEVTAVDGDRIRLDRTAFYPGGGGQPADTGVLTFRGQDVRVVASSKDDGGIWHRVEGAPPIVGERVAGRVDRQRRLQLMRTHTAMHILCGVIWRDHKASVTGGQMAPLQGRMDFEFPSMRQELVRSIEQAVNVELRRADLNTCVLGKGPLPRAGEYASDVLLEGLAAFLQDAKPSGVDADTIAEMARGLVAHKAKAAAALGPLPPRPPAFCTGCPERPVFSAIKLMQRELGPTHISADIG